MKYKIHNKNYCKKRLEELAKDDLFSCSSEKDYIDNNINYDNLFSLIPYASNIADEIIRYPSYLKIDRGYLDDYITNVFKKIKKSNLDNLLDLVYDIETTGRICTGVAAYYNDEYFLSKAKDCFFIVSQGYLYGKDLYRKEYVDPFINRIDNIEEDLNWFENMSNYYKAIYYSLPYLTNLISKYFKEIQIYAKLVQSVENSNPTKEIADYTNYFLDYLNELKSYLKTNNYSYPVVESMIKKIHEYSTYLELPKYSIDSYLEKIFNELGLSFKKV